MKDIKELQNQKRELNLQLNAIYDIAETRELNDEEKKNERSLTVKLERVNREIDDILQERQVEATNPRQAEKTVNQYLREILQGARRDKANREITLLPVDGAPKGSITDSGAINLSIHDLIPTLQEGLGLPKGVTIATGVVGNELIPYGIDDAEMEEVGEVAPLNDQMLHFDKLTVTQARTGLCIVVSNMAIDNAAFDLMGYVRTKFPLAVRKYLAKKIFSHAAFSGIKGPISELPISGTITIGDGKEYKTILTKVAEFADKGFDTSDVCLAIDNVTEANLLATPKLASGVGGFLIENGKLAGYDYVKSHYVNTKSKGGSGEDKYDIVPDTQKSLLIGFWNYLQVQQHGEVRMTVDATSKAVAIKNVTALVMNTAWSITDLSTKINGGNGNTGATATQAFARFAIAEKAE